MIQEIPDEGGTWLTIEERDGAQLRAIIHAGNDEFDQGVTVFWPSWQSAVPFHQFFETAKPRVEDFRPDVRTMERLSAYERITGDPVELETELNPSEFGFIRFDLVRVGNSGEERPALVVWINQEAGSGEVVPPDAAGVFFQPVYLDSLEQPLATLITETSVERPDLASVVSLLEELANRLRPDAEPMVAYG
ncbi:hypothetical protein [Erythrobacter sp.]|uniref:hypothetical protein n=1 Tax=Erythrobacter sp. TaxID=1042 RepID=UPI001AFF729F|nr:hypothetical protein [Erythrobacter sp.]MBO6527961.1 hypothetical protein [Erythrobacter sp.]MBO6528646.1 hypothetical protein [Erythrobacter sp.]